MTPSVKSFRGEIGVSLTDVSPRSTRCLAWHATFATCGTDGPSSKHAPPQPTYQSHLHCFSTFHRPPPLSLSPLPLDDSAVAVETTSDAPPRTRLYSLQVLLLWRSLRPLLPTPRPSVSALARGRRPHNQAPLSQTRTPPPSLADLPPVCGGCSSAHRDSGTGGPGASAGAPLCPFTPPLWQRRRRRLRLRRTCPLWPWGTTARLASHPPPLHSHGAARRGGHHRPHRPGAGRATGAEPVRPRARANPPRDTRADAGRGPPGPHGRHGGLSQLRSRQQRR